MTPTVSNSNTDADADDVIGATNHPNVVISLSSPLLSPLLARFDMMYHYRPSPLLTDDENYMDIVMIITRSSKLRQGSMGCLLVRPRTTCSHLGEQPLPIAATEEKDTDTNDNSKNNETTVSEHQDDEANSSLMNRIIAATTNTSLFTPKDSDVHAEINAIGQVAKRLTASNATSFGSSNRTIIDTMTTQGATAYITMPPCKKCFGALYASGIVRIVSRRSHPTILHNAASKLGIQLVTMTQGQVDSQRKRLDQLFSQNISSTRDVRGKDGASANELVVENEVGVDTRNRNIRKHATNEVLAAEERDRKISKLEAS